MKRIVVKVGSNVLTRLDGTLDVTRMSALVDQMAELHKAGTEVILVSSGAVASGRSEVHPHHNLDDVSQRQLYSAVGQAKLIDRYYQLFREHGITVGQVLTMKENFASYPQFLNQKNCMRVMIENGVIPIVNENDTVSITELMFTDNDELSGLIASMMDAQALIILSNIDGIYNGSPDDPDTQVIREIGEGSNLSDFLQAAKSTFGRGGIQSKTRIARQVADEGIAVIIANGKRENILLDLVKRPQETLCTRFIPKKTVSTSSLKRGELTSPLSGKGGILEEAATAVRSLASLSDRRINEILLAVAEAVLGRADYILGENRRDLQRMDAANPKYDRLLLTEARLQDIAAGIRNVAALPSPLGHVLKERTLPNGLKLRRVSVPFGVIGIIYEARPNVTFDVFSLCLKSGNVCLLKGGSDADCTNNAIVDVIHEVLERFGVNPHIVQLLPATREAAADLLHANGHVDLIIPRGSTTLINFVRQNATVPVIETGAGVCHAYFERSGDVEMGAKIICNAKTRRVSVCNALDCLIIGEESLKHLPRLCEPLQADKVVIYADQPAYVALRGSYPAELLKPVLNAYYGREFLDYKMAIKTVYSFDEALMHIRYFGSKHSECIITNDRSCADRFCREVDAACVYVNAPTSFTDGAQFGLGAEIGISTQKLHARGPMALEEITTYKWIIEGNGQIRS